MSLRSTPLKTQPRLNISNFDLIKHFHFSIWRYNAIIAYSKIKHWQKQILWWKYTSENNVNGSDNEHWSCWEGIDHTGKAGLIWRFDIWKCCGICYSDNGLNSFLTMLVTFFYVDDIFSSPISIEDGVEAQWLSDGWRHLTCKPSESSTIFMRICQVTNRTKCNWFKKNSTVYSTHVSSKIEQTVMEHIFIA